MAILFPEVQFLLVDSIRKKLDVVNHVSTSLGLKNVSTRHTRAEHIDEQFDFIVSRAVTHMNTFYSWIDKLTLPTSNHELTNGILYLKGGDLEEELKNFPESTRFPLSDYFDEDFFTTKFIVHVPVN